MKNNETRNTIEEKSIKCSIDSKTLYLIINQTP